MEFPIKPTNVSLFVQLYTFIWNYFYDDLAAVTGECSLILENGGLSAKKLFCLITGSDFFPLRHAQSRPSTSSWSRCHKLVVPRVPTPQWYLQNPEEIVVVPFSMLVMRLLFNRNFINPLIKDDRADHRPEKVLAEKMIEPIIDPKKYLLKRW